MPGGIRTPNLLIRSQMLYPVELQTQHDFRLPICDCKQGETTLKPLKFGIWMLEFGFSLAPLGARVADGTRTRNNQNHNLGLYH